MAEIKTQRLEVTTDLSGPDIEQLGLTLPRLGSSGLAVLQLIRDIAAAAEKSNCIVYELHLSTEDKSKTGIQVRTNILNQGISILDLPGGVLRLLEDNGIGTVGNLTAISESEFSKLKGIGKTSLRYVKGALGKHGLSLGCKQE